jgi:ElaB/YqjD/DUF883 family membrane-anchored ribosome-binding protein
MDQEPEVIRQQLEQTRSSLTDKIEQLEQTVGDTVQSTTEAVASTMESVKDAVQDTVETMKGTVRDTVDSVKETFDVRRYFAQYPWAAFGTAVGVGFAGNILLGSGRHSAASHRIGEMHSRGQPATSAPPASHNGGTRKRTVAGLTNGVTQKFGGELEKLQGVAVGAAFGLLRDWIGRSAPHEVGAKLGEVIDDVTRRLGGEPFRENLLDSISGFVGKVSGDRDVVQVARGGGRVSSS